jgi:predicted O-methyltransferase YrrM
MPRSARLMSSSTIACLRPGGLLFSDDAAWNAAFPEFCNQVAAKHRRILRGVGLLQKNHGPLAAV